MKKIETEKRQKVLKKIGWTLFSLFFLLVLFFVYINLPMSEINKAVPLGVTFSARYASDIGLDWKQAYVAMLDDLKVKNIRIPIYWDLVEKEKGTYLFDDLDWQLQEAAKRDAKVILVVGEKVPRWPECFVPEWVSTDDDVKKEALLNFENVVINRYKDNHPEVISWQIENEPFLNFGICGTIPAAQVDAEIAQARKIDPSRKIVVTDSGELSLWLQAAQRADVFGTTMYREVYSSREFLGKPLGHWRYPIGPNFFKLKRLLIRIFADQKNAMVIELQGEPWVQGWTTDAPLELQLESMNANILADNVSFAKKTDMEKIYIWGVEWWYWLAEEKGDYSVWNKARELFAENEIK